MKRLDRSPITVIEEEGVMEAGKKLVLLDKENNIGIITLNDPPLNLSSRNNISQFADVLDRIEADPDIDVVVLRAVGKYFGAGHDAKEMRTDADEEMLKKFDFIRLYKENLTERISEMTVPFIAALDGSAYGGAFERALACDMRIAAKGIVCCLSEIKFGTFAGTGAVPRLLEIVGPARAIEHMLRSTKLTAEELYQMGVINAVVEDGKAFETAMEWAREIAAMPKSGIHAVKEAVAAFLRPQRDEFFPKQQALSKRIYGAGIMAATGAKFLNKEFKG
jgi:enoyl-CoA hydratase/carnithine racemase